MFSGKLKLDDDDDFFGDIENSRTNLSNIFGVPVEKSTKDVDHTFKYTPTKQANEQQSQEQNSSSSWSILSAKVVNAFKLVNQENISQGKIGLAILKNPDNLHKIILYKTKTNILSTLTLKDVKLYFKDSYLQFRDDFQVFWSVLVEDREIVDLIKAQVSVEENSCIDQTPEDNLNIAETSLPSLVESQTEMKGRKSGNVSSDEKTRESKAQILSRMAKMGKPLPKFAPTTTDLSDSSDADVKKKIPPKATVIQRKPKLPQKDLVPVIATKPQIQSNIITGVVPYGGGESQFLGMLLTENRTQNTEVRMNISKLESKIERVLDKIDFLSIKTADSNKGNKDDETIALEEKLLELKKENRSLRQKINELESTPKQAEAEIAEVQEHKEEAEENIAVEEDFSEFNDIIENYQLNRNDFTTPDEFLKEIIRQTISKQQELQSIIETNSNNIAAYKNSLKELENEINTKNELLKKNEELEKKYKELDRRLVTLQKENENLQSQFEDNKQQSEKAVENLVKGIMNNLYQMLVKKIDEDKYYSSTEILRICGNAIKLETNNAIKLRNNK